MNNWKNYERHQLSALYKDLPSHDFQLMVEAVKRHGVVGGRRIVLHEGKVLDGWQLYQACIAADVRPEFVQLSDLGFDDPASYVTLANDIRRHETYQERIERAIQRQKAVQRQAGKGMSIRQIARAQGVSKSQIHRDLARGRKKANAGGLPGLPANAAPKSRPGSPPKLDSFARHLSFLILHTQRIYEFYAQSKDADIRKLFGKEEQKKTQELLQGLAANLSKWKLAIFGKAIP